MFDRLKSAFSNAAKSLGERELKEKDIDSVLSELEISLLESDVAIEVTSAIKSDLQDRLVGTSVAKDEIEKFIRDSLVGSVSGLFDSTGMVDLLDNIRKKKESGQPYIIVFVGINGTGKTTSLVKVAHLLQSSKFSIVVAAADTFRAGAIEQLREHADRLNLKTVAQNYGADPAAVARDAVLYAKSHKIDCVLVDTAGRMQTSKNLMEQISKIITVVKPDFKIFVGDSLAGNDTVNQAREFYEYVKFDGSILTKSDADAKGGAALSIVKTTGTPVMYVGVGQEYADLKPFLKEDFIKTVFGDVKIPSARGMDLKPDTDSLLAQNSPDAVSSADIDSPDTDSSDLKKPADAQLEPESSTDPFEGIETADIDKYADLYDVPAPETDIQAKRLASDIREWILQGRLEPDADNSGDDAKKTKKRSLFGRFGK